MKVIARKYRAGATAGALAVLFSTLAVAQQPKPTNITVALSSAGFSIANLRLAQEAGFFSERGIDVKFVVMDSGNAATAALISGSAQFVASGPATAIAARARQQPLVCVANIYRGLSASLALSSEVAGKLGVNPKAPVEDRLRALQGLSLAFPSATSAFLGPIKQSTQAMQIAPKFVYMAQTAMPAAMSSGAIQGMMAGPTAVVPAVQNGSAVLWIDGPGAELPAEFMPTSSSCLQTTDAFAKNNTDIVKRMRTVLRKAGELVKSDPAAAKSFLSKAFPKLDAAQLDALFAAESASWTRTNFDVSDIRQEIKLLMLAENPIAGVGNIDPSSILYQP